MFEASSPMPPALAGRANRGAGFVPLPGIDFRELLGVLWRGKLIIALSMCVALGLAAAAMLVVPYKYTATTQILIDPMDLRASQNEGNGRCRS